MGKRTLIKGGCVITLDRELGDFPCADVLIEDGKIRAVGPQLDATDCEVVDASEMIVLPGFVDTHRHVWEAVIRNVGPDWSLPTYLHHIYFNGLGGVLRPEDAYIGNLLGALEALDAGVTTVLDWSMVNSPDHADEMVRALQESGIRFVYGYGTPLRGAGAYWSRDSQLLHPDDCRRVRERYFSSDDQLGTMALAIRGPEFCAWEAAVHDIHLARELGVIATMHLGFGTWGSVDRSVERLYRAGLLGPDLNFTHATKLSDEEYRLIAEAGCSVSICPEIEMMMGHGYPPTDALVAQGGRPTIGIDVVTSTGGDMFTQMKFLLHAARARVNEATLASGQMPERLLLSAREVLEFATIEGARALHLDHRIGTLTPGKDADLIMIRRTDINLYPVNDPVGAVVLCANTGNVDSVFVAGRAVKRGGRLVGVDLDRVRRLAAASRDYIFAEYGVPEGAAPLSA